VTSNGSPLEPAAVVERWISEYNALNFEGMAACLAPDLEFRYYNRGYSFSTRDQLMETLKAFADEYMPDRQMGPALRVAAVGRTVYREHVWSGTLRVDLAAFGKAGDRVEKRLCAVYTVDSGAITEYFDYG
jgi:hypothetical protein